MIQLSDDPDHCRFTFWANGETSNPGIQEIAELGSGGAFMEEVDACGASCGPGEGFMCEPMSGVCSAKGEVRMVAAYPYLSTATMVAPSPDWCAPSSPSLQLSALPAVLTHLSPSTAAACLLLCKKAIIRVLVRFGEACT